MGVCGSATPDRNLLYPVSPTPADNNLITQTRPEWEANGCGNKTSRQTTLPTLRFKSGRHCTRLLPWNYADATLVGDFTGAADRIASGTSRLRSAVTAELKALLAEARCVIARQARFRVAIFNARRRCRTRGIRGQQAGWKHEWGEPRAQLADNGCITYVGATVGRNVRLVEL